MMNKSQKGGESKIHPSPDGRERKHTRYAGAIGSASGLSMSSNKLIYTGEKATPEGSLTRN